MRYATQNTDGLRNFKRGERLFLASERGGSIIIDGICAIRKQ